MAAGERAIEQRRVDVLIREAMVSATHGLDLDVVREVVDGAVAVAREIVRGLEGRAWADVDATDATRAAGQLVKAVDELVRLAAFSKGQPDSRPGIGAGGGLAADWAALLTDEQLATVHGWLADAERRLSEAAAL